MLIDTHAHLYWDSFKKDFDEVIQRSLDGGISTIINVGVAVDKSQIALDQVKNTKWPQGLSVYSTVGIHPHEALRLAPLAQGKLSEALEQIYLSNPQKVVAVGECGLDYSKDKDYNNYNYYKEQIMLFEAQIKLAKKLKLPLVVHTRDDRSQNPTNTQCWDKVIEMTKDHFGIYHCYSGLEQTTRRTIEETNFLISFAATITYPKNEYLREAVKTIPLDRIVLETDCPFLPPQSKRGQRNEPTTVLEIAEVIAELKGVSLEEVAKQTTKNAKTLFKIS